MAYTRPTENPDWATGEGGATPNVDPAGLPVSTGYPDAGIPSAKGWNWLFQLIGNWIGWLDQLTQTIAASLWDSTEDSFTGTVSNSTGPKTATIKWRRKRDLIILSIPQIASLNFTGTDLFITGLATAIADAKAPTGGYLFAGKMRVYCGSFDGDADVFIDQNGTITFVDSNNVNDPTWSCPVSPGYAVIYPGTLMFHIAF
jgi:hypothetical protein